jgi:hypothetical protein
LKLSLGLLVRRMQRPDVESDSGIVLKRCYVADPNQTAVRYSRLSVNPVNLIATVITHLLILAELIGGLCPLRGRLGHHIKVQCIRIRQICVRGYIKIRVVG